MKNKFIIWLFVSLISVKMSAQEQTLVMEPTEVTMETIANIPVNDSSCHNYCVIGVCFWLFCTIYECEVRTSIKVGHYNPDLVVSVYDIPGNNPWQEAEQIYGELEKDAAESWVDTWHIVEAGQGHRVEGGSEYQDQSLRYHEATAIGHPKSVLGDYLSDTGYFCPSEADIMAPYYSSGLDGWAWRLGLTEMIYLAYFMPGARVVGDGMQQQWGPVYPRTGFLLQKDYAKGAAVIAQRVGNIVTREYQPHLYYYLYGNNYEKTWLPGELDENNPDTGVWQMIAPKQDKQCYAFGENDVLNRVWSEGRTSEDNRYAFSLWRPYKCCKKEGAFITSIDSPQPVCIP